MVELTLAFLSLEPAFDLIKSPFMMLIDAVGTNVYRSLSVCTYGLKIKLFSINFR